METKIATSIDTDLFYRIIKYLKNTGWHISIEYSPKIFDKGIDFDLYQLERNGEKVLLAWTNWFEGELKASSALIESIEQQFGLKFKFEEADNLNWDNIIDEMKNLLDFK